MLYLFTKKQLLLIECELKSLGLWANEPPSDEAMSDPTPFACQSMPFEHWLQFIFIPKMSLIVTERKSLPQNIALGPMAEHIWSLQPKMKSLITIIYQLDERLSEPR